MHYFFGVRFGSGFTVDNEFISKNRSILFIRNLLAIVAYGLVYKQIMSNAPDVAAILLFLAMANGLMLGLLIGKTLNSTQ